MISFLEFLVESKVINVDHKYGYGKVKVINDPNKKHVDNLLNSGQPIRGTNTKQHGMFIWNANDAIHHQVRSELKVKHGYDVSDSLDGNSNTHQDFVIHPSNKTIYAHNSSLEDRDKHLDDILNHKSLLHLKKEYETA